MIAFFVIYIFIKFSINYISIIYILIKVKSYCNKIDKICNKK